MGFEIEDTNFLRNRLSCVEDSFEGFLAVQSVEIKVLNSDNLFRI